MSNSFEALDHTIIKSLEEFFYQIREENWIGREHEAVSLFVFSHLIKKCAQDSVLYDPAQICIEGAVPPTLANKKKTVNKDLVIWEKGAMNCFKRSGNNLITDYAPLAVLEWKVLGFWRKLRHPDNVKKSNEYDREWLEAFTKQNPSTLGYAILLNIEQEGYKLYYWNYRKGKLEGEQSL